MQYTLDLASLEPDVALDDGVFYLTNNIPQDLIERLLNSDIIGLDLETYGDAELDGLRWWQGKIRLIQLGFSDGCVYILDWLKLPDTVKQELLPHLKASLESKDIVKLGHNLKFDICFLIGALNIHPRRVRDSMIESQVLYAGVREYRHGLAPVVKRELGIEVDKSEQTSNWGRDNLRNTQLNYAAKDVRILFELDRALKDKLTTEDLIRHASLENANVPVFAEMECAGFPIDTNRTEETLRQHEELSDRLSQPFRDRFPSTSLTASAKTLVPLLNTTFIIDLASTDDGELSRFKDIPEIKALSDFRSLKKHIDYLKGMMLCVRNSRVYTNYRQLNPAGFGRSGCGKLNRKSTAKDGINIQNVPNPLREHKIPSIRSCFKPLPGQCLIVADLSSAHARIATQSSKDPTLVKVYNEDCDMHIYTAVNLAKQAGHEWDYELMISAKENKCDPNHQEVKRLRTLAKPIFYSSLNLGGAKTLQVTALKDGIELTIEEATAAKNAWRDAYGKLYEKQKDIISKANYQRKQLPNIEANFGVLRSLSKRRLWMKKFPDRFKEGKYTVKASDAVAFYWTATEADAMKFAMYLIQEEFDAHPEWQGQIVNLSHDELDVVGNEDYAEAIATCVMDSMARGMRQYITIIPVEESGVKPVDCIVKSWADK